MEASQRQPSIDVKNITKSFDDKRVVDDISMRVNPGEIYGFLGPNGSGKTTFLRMICGLLTPDSGSGTCLGLDILQEAAELKRRVGYMTQKFSYYEDLTIQENLEFVARLYGIPHRKSVVKDSLEKLGLYERRKQLAGQLSGGWKQRLALAACLLHQPKLLLLDEPTAGVDPKARRDFWEEIHDLAAEGLTILITTHYIDEAERCHRLTYIAYGHLMTEGTVQEVIDKAGLATVEISNGNQSQITEQLRASDAISQVVPFGSKLRVSGNNRQEMEKAIEPVMGAECEWRPVQTNLDDVFISLMKEAEDNFG